VSPPPSAGARLGVVDDDRIFRRSLALGLTQAGYHVDEYEDALDYLRRRPAAPHDALVLDVDMPGMSGIDLQTALSRGAAPPLVFVSGAAEVPQSVAAMRQGAVDFLVKPFRLEQLMDALGRAVERGARDRALSLEREALEPLLGRLTERERTVCELVVTGRLNKQVAAELGTTENTVKVHRARAMEKLGLETLPDLVRLLDRARELGLSVEARVKPDPE
jgi:FixJ family two-component response regulator